MTSTTPTVVFQPLHDDVIVPSRSTEESAGYDVRAYINGRTVKLRRSTEQEVSEVTVTGGKLILEPGDTALVPTGFKAQVPAGYEAQVRIRSSMAFKRGISLPNAPGTIDSDYPDEWLIMIRNHSQGDVTLQHGERIAQVVLSRFTVLDWQVGEVGIMTDRKGGFGSTGEI
ncbi:MAG: dUTP diphosphatase [Gemmatimonadota bacterium]|nr:MAG: dUTP diphosphatase [Gemmatimonadota bacterium]